MSSTALDTTLTGPNGSALSPIAAVHAVGANNGDVDIEQTNEKGAYYANTGAAEASTGAVEATKRDSTTSNTIADESKGVTPTERMLAELLQLNESKHTAMGTATLTTANKTTTGSPDESATTAAVLSASKALASSNADSILLSMLDSEVHRLRTIDKTRKEGLERSERDGKRMSTLLNLAHDQLGQYKVRNEALHTQCETLSKTVKTLTEAKETAEKKFALAVEDKAAMKVMSTNNSAASTAMIAKLELEKKLQEETIQRLRSDISGLERSKREELDLAEIERRKAFEMRVALETRLKTVEEEMGFLQEMRQKETKSATMREYDLSVTIQTLKKEISELRGTQESTHRNAFETMSSVRMENAALTEKVTSFERELTEVRRSGFEKVTKLQTLLDAKTELLEQQGSSAKAREQALETQIQKLITDLRVAQAEVNTLADQENSRSEEHVNKVIRLNSELNVVNQRLADSLEEIERLKAKLQQHIVDAAIAKENATNAFNNSKREQLDKLAMKTNELNTAAVELQWKSEKLSSTETRLNALLDEFNNAAERHANESAALKREVEGYKQVVAKLNKHIEENIENRLLTEQNSHLLAKIEAMKGQISSVNAALSNARVETNIVENSRTLLLIDQVDSQLTRLNALEKERLEMRPLLERLALYFEGSTSAAGLGTAVLAAAGTTTNNNTITNSSANVQQAAPHNQRHLMLIDPAAVLLSSSGGTGGSENNTLARLGSRGGVIKGGTYNEYANSSPSRGGGGGGGDLKQSSSHLSDTNFVQTGTIGGLLAIAKKSVVGSAPFLAAAVSSSASSSGGATSGGAYGGGGRSVTFLGGKTADLTNNNNNNNNNNHNYANNNIARRGSAGGGDAGGGEGSDVNGATPATALINPEVLLALRAEEAALHRSVEAFFRKFGSSAPSGEESSGAGRQLLIGGNDASSSPPYASSSPLSLTTAAAGVVRKSYPSNASPAGAPNNNNNSAYVSSSFPMIPTSRVRRVN